MTKLELEALAYVKEHAPKNRLGVSAMIAVKRIDELEAQVEKLRSVLDRIVNSNWWTPLNYRDELDEARRALAATAPGGEAVSNECNCLMDTNRNCPVHTPGGGT